MEDIYAAWHQPNNFRHKHRIDLIYIASFNLQAAGCLQGCKLAQMGNQPKEALKGAHFPGGYDPGDLTITGCSHQHGEPWQVLLNGRLSGCKRPLGVMPVRNNAPLTTRQRRCWERKHGHGAGRNQSPVAPSGWAQNDVRLQS